VSKFQISAGALNQALKSASIVIERRNTIPILSLVRMVASGNMLTVKATDLDIEIMTSALLTGPVKKPVVFCVSPFAIMAATSSLPKDWPVDVELVDAGVRVAWKWGEMTLCTLPAGDYPEQFNDTTPVAVLAIPEKGLAPLAKAATCISTEETRYYLNGVCLDRDPQTRKALLVATDGHRLTAAATDWDISDEVAQVIMPRKFVGIWRQLLASAEHELHVSSSPRGMIVQTFSGNVVISSKVIDGKFPEWRRVVPKAEGRQVVTLSRTVASAAVAALLRFIKAGGGNRSKAGTLYVEGGRAYLDCKHENLGNLHFDLGAARGPDVWVGVNMVYVGEMLKLIGGDEVSFSMNGQGDPVTIAPAGGSGDTFIVMPLRTEAPPKRFQQEQGRAA